MTENTIIDRIESYLLKGLVISIPLLLTLFILSFALGFVANIVSPLTGFIESFLGIDNLPNFVFEILSVTTLMLIILLVGFVADVIPTAKKLTEIFHALMESIPGLGSVYSSFRKMSETMIQGGNSFRDVKLVEYPSENCYTLAFVTAGENPVVSDIVGEKTITMFIPMAPNPFMGGFVMSLPQSRVHEIDMTVQEGIKAVITSGITMTADPNDVELGDELNDIQDLLDGDE